MSYSRRIGQISSGVMSQGDRFGEVGVYELEIVMDYDLFREDTDREGYIKKCIATHLAGCAASTGIPIGEGYWIVKLNDWTVKHFQSLPKEFRI